MDDEVFEDYDRELELAFRQRFGEAVRVLRQKAAGHTVLVFQPVMAGA